MPLGFVKVYSALCDFALSNDLFLLPFLLYQFFILIDFLQMLLKLLFGHRLVNLANCCQFFFLLFQSCILKFIVAFNHSMH